MKMHLLILILSNVDAMPHILRGFMEDGIKGTTIVDCEGMLRVINNSNINPPPIFGSLRQYLNPERPKGKILFTVLSEDRISSAKAIIDKEVGGIENPDTGICFTIPLQNVAGL